MKRRMRDDSWAIRMSDLESLTPLQRSALTARLVRQAREARAHAIGAALLRLVQAWRRREGLADMSLAGSELQGPAMWCFAVRAAEAIRAVWARHASRRRQLRELRELCAMDDMLLKDLGISRLDIQASIRSGVDLRSARH